MAEYEEELGLFVEQEQFDDEIAQKEGIEAEEDGGDDLVPNSATAGGSQRVAAPVPPQFQVPNHPLFAPGGIMFGLGYNVNQTSNNRSLALDPARQAEKRSAAVYGHNGFAVGAWWPCQAAALFHGCHGSWQGGISGDKNNGAYSIVISGSYKGLNQDFGDNVFYSGPGSYENDDATKPKDSDGSKMLLSSYDNERCIRVLRSAKGRGEWYPSAGIRYDGLYVVDHVREYDNKKGGKYLNFELRRLDDQMEFVDLNRIPDQQQMQIAETLKAGV